jgi:scyllo-inositol 2-dehydrogenase (NADP+)
MSAVDPIRVGIIGQGRSGYGIHVKNLQHLPEHYQVVAVMDPIAERVAASARELNCRAYDSVAGLLADEQVELVIVASPNGFHASQATAALEAGKHVLCEKPFGTSLAEVDRMLAARDRAGRILQPFQQRRYEADFRKVQQILASGLLGEIRFVRLAWHGFKRRWDWQTLTSASGGELNNNGPHPLDHALELFGDGEPEVWCDKQNCLASGDAEDHVKIILSAPHKPTIEIELSSIVAYAQERWLVCGTAGGLHGTGARLDWKWVDWAGMPARPVESASTPDRSYNGETLSWQEDHWEPQAAVDAGGGAAPAAQPALDLYAGLARSLRAGAPQEITPESVRRRVAIIDLCHRVIPPASVIARHAEATASV